MTVKDAVKTKVDVCLSMSMYPPENETECNVCGAPPAGEHHPNCPVASGEPFYIMDGDILNILTNSIAVASEQYMKQKKAKVDEGIATTRFKQMQEDYLEMGSFAQAMFDVGMLLKAEDVVFFIQNTNKFEPYYLLWMELNRPQEGDETWTMFEKEVWNRIMKGVDEGGQQTEDTGN